MEVAGRQVTQQRTWPTMMEEGEQIKHTCMYGVCHYPHNWSKGEEEGRMLVQQRMRLVVGMSSVTKGG